MAGQEPEPPMRIGFVAYLLHPVLVEDRRPLVAAGDGYVDELGEESALRAEDGVHRFGRDVRASGYGIDRGPDVAPFDEQRPGCLKDGVAGGPRLLATTRGVVRAAVLDRLRHTATVAPYWIRS